MINANEYTGPIEADGNHYTIYVPEGTEWRAYVLQGDSDGSITVAGAGRAWNRLC